MLRGRCRDCHEPISLRYPLVEALTAAMFLVLALQELLSGGMNLPQAHPAGQLPAALDMLQVLGIYCFHLLLVSTLLAAALIQYDGNRPPTRLFLPALVVGLAAPAVWPFLHPAAEWFGTESPMAAAVFDGLVGLAIGIAVGGLLGIRRHEGDRRSNAGLMWSLGLAGLFLGWQAAVGLTLWTAAAALAYRMATFLWTPRGPPALDRLADAGYASMDPRLGMACTTCHVA